MTPKSIPIGEDDLTAFVDGELSDERRAMVAAWLSDHPAEQRRIEADIDIRARLRRALDPLTHEGLPERLRLDSIRREMAARHMKKTARIAAGVALLALGVAGGWGLKGALTPYGKAPVGGGEQQLALAAYRLYVPEKLHPVEVSASARDHLGVWLGKRIGTRVVVPDLSAAGLSLIGGRLLPGENGAAGMLMYQDTTGARATLFLEGGKGAQSAFAFQETDGANMLAWRDPEMAYVLTGPFGRDRLLGIAHFIHAAMG